MSSKTVYAGKYITVTEEPSPDGKQPIEKVKIRDGVSVIIVTKPDTLRFIREYDKVRDEERIKLVSAYVEDGEDPLACAQRELKDETGLAAKNWKLLHCYEAKGTIQKKQYFYIASDITEGEASPDKHEDIHGHTDMTYSHTGNLAVEGTFGKSQSAYAILKFVLQNQQQ